MRIGVFTMIVVSLVFLLSIVNSFWIGRLFRQPLRRRIWFAYSVLTLLGAAAYLGLRSTGALEGWAVLNFIYYFGPFWTVLQLLLLLAWPFSFMAALLQRRWSVSEEVSASNTQESSSLNPGMTRRTFLSNAAILPPVAMTGINAVGVLDAEFGAVLRRIDFAYPDLPPTLDGLKIAHMTDVHIGPYVSARDVNKLTDLLHAASPDLLAITGDFVDDVAKLPGVMAAMKPFLSDLPLGAWFCMGNHEHLRGAAPIRAILQKSGIHILDNRHQRLPFGEGYFTIAGVDYPIGSSTAVRPDTARRYIEEACLNIPRQDFTLLMAHHPDFLPPAFERSISLTLAGHTHGGQVGWGDRSALQFLYPYMRGVYRDEQSFGFVSSGAGHWLPFRLNCPPEVSLITLKRAT